MESMKILHWLAFAATWVCFVVGIGLLACGYGFYHHSQNFLATCVHADGTVIENVPAQMSGDSSTVYYPKFSFQTPDGQTHTVKSDTGSSPASYSVGQHVQVLYTPGNPDNAKPHAFWSLWLAPTVFTIMGIAGLIGWIFWWIIDRKVIVPKLRAPAS
jgi:hypothetical protein